MSDNNEKKVSDDALALMAFQAGSKSTGVAYLLWFFLGGFGIHRFYLGSSMMGVVLLLCTLAGFALIFPFIITAIVLIYDLFTLPSQVDAVNKRLVNAIKSGGN